MMRMVVMRSVRIIDDHHYHYHYFHHHHYHHHHFHHHQYHHHYHYHHHHNYHHHHHHHHSLQIKFGITPGDEDSIREVVQAYVEGLY
jgi:5'-3' exonuclease